MSQQESAGYLIRQMDKVHRPASAIKVVRAYTRELKRAKRAELQKTNVEALSGIARELISSAGKTTAGFAQGTITGPVLLVVLLATAGKLGLLAPFVDFLGQSALAIRKAWFEGTAQKSVQAALDLITPDLPAISVGPGNFCARITQQYPFALLSLPIPVETCFQTAELRDAFMTTVRNKLGVLAFMFKFEAVNK